MIYIPPHRCLLSNTHTHKQAFICLSHFYFVYFFEGRRYLNAAPHTINFATYNLQGALVSQKIPTQQTIIRKQPAEHKAHTLDGVLRDPTLLVVVGREGACIILVLIERKFHTTPKNNKWDWFLVVLYIYCFAGCTA